MDINPSLLFSREEADNQAMGTLSDGGPGFKFTRTPLEVESSSMSINYPVLLLMGETGAGKSTFINAFFNYLNYPTMEEALQSTRDLNFPIPSRFVKFDGDGAKVEVFVGEGTDKERLNKPGESQTLCPLDYTLTTKEGNTVRLVDTGGITDTYDTENDKEKIYNLLSFLSGFGKLHGIGIVLRLDKTRFTPSFKYCINELLKNIHKDMAKNLFFICTHSRGANFEYDKTHELLNDLFGAIEIQRNVKIPLVGDRIFCMDNESIEKLALIKKGGVKFTPKQMKQYSESWTISAEKCHQIMKFLSTLPPHFVRGLTLNDARLIVFDLMYVLPHVSEVISNNLVTIKNSGKRSTEIALDKLYTIELKQLECPRTVCSNCGKFVKTKNGYVKDHNLCVEIYLSQTTREEDCGMRYTDKCTDCGCGWEEHMDIRCGTLFVEIGDVVIKQEEMKVERDAINDVGVRLIGLVNSRSLRPLNDRMLAYFDMLLKTAEQIVAQSVNEPDHELQKQKLESFRHSHEDYKNKKQFIESLLKNAASSSSSSAVYKMSSKDVENLLTDLYELPHFGKTIKQMVEEQQKARKHQQRDCAEEESFKKVFF